MLLLPAVVQHPRDGGLIGREPLICGLRHGAPATGLPHQPGEGGEGEGGTAREGRGRGAVIGISVDRVVLGL